VKIVTFNLRYGTAEDGDNRWDLRKDLLLHTIRDINPDVMAVQESLPFQADELQMEFPKLAHFGKGRYHSITLDRLHETLSGEHCSIFFRTDRFALEKCGTFWHSDTPDVAGSISWGNSLARTTTWGRFADRANDTRFCVFNSHFHWNEPYVGNTAELLREQIPVLSDGLPTVVVGDFNAAPGSDLHRRLVQSDDAPILRDVWESAGQSEDDSGTSHGFAGEPQERIDWILATSDIQPVSIRNDSRHHDGRFPSDHFPVIAELVIDINRGRNQPG